MRAAINVATLNQDLSLEDFVQVAGATGWEGVELIVPEKLMAYAEEHGVDGAQRLLADAGVAMAHFFIGLPMQAEGAEFDRALEAAAEKCRLARSLGMSQVGVWLPPRTEQPQARARADLAMRLRDAAQLAAEHGLQMTVEFIGTLRGGTPLVATLTDVLQVIEAAGESNLGALVDLFHFYVGGSELADLRAMPLELLTMVHVDDAPPGDLEQLKDADRVMPGDGVMPVVEMLRICAEKGYEGWASLELFGDKYRQMEPEQAGEIGLKAVERVMAEALA
ncbi:MAG TPA: sugar phosphate isomerase/epimerase [Armatimonadota bacterium]|nr:sugar phosphate isomerase/epimerase [Armatimonadota bacterium]